MGLTAWNLATQSNGSRPCFLRATYNVSGVSDCETQNGRNGCCGWIHRVCLSAAEVAHVISARRCTQPHTHTHTYTIHYARTRGTHKAHTTTIHTHTQFTTHAHEAHTRYAGKAHKSHCAHTLNTLSTHVLGRWMTTSS